MNLEREVEKLLGHTFEQLEALSDDALVAAFPDVFNFEKDLINTAALKVVPDEVEDDEESDVEYETKIKRVKTGDSKAEKLAKKKEQMMKDKLELLELMEGMK